MGSGATPMMRPLVCSLCGARVPRHSEGARFHEDIRCGEWSDLVRELERMHHLHPEPVELLIRALIRNYDRADGLLEIIER